MKNPNWTKVVRPPRKKPGPKPRVTIPSEDGFVVKIGFHRAHDDETFLCDYAKAPAGFAKAVGMGDLQVAEFFIGEKHGQTAYQQARTAAHWQLGTVWRARRFEDGKIELLFEEV